MIHQLNLPEFSKELRVKDIIITILSAEENLTLAQLSHKARKEFRCTKSYQAIFRSLKDLIDNGIVIKKDVRYSLNMAWVKRLRDYAEQILKSDERKSMVHFAPGIISVNHQENITKILFDSLLNLDKFWVSIKGEYFQNSTNESEVSIWEGNHCWWLLVYPELEYAKILESHEKRVHSYKICHGTTALDRWSMKFYEEAGTKIKLKEKSIGSDIAVFGDTIMQVRLPQNLLDKIDDVYNLHARPTEINIHKFIREVIAKPEKIELILTRNQELAQQLRIKIIEEFSK